MAPTRMRGFSDEYGILEHDLKVPARAAELAGRERAHVQVLEPDLAGRRLDQPQQAASGRRLAAAGFADEPERLARRDREAHVVDRAHRRRLAEPAAARRELLDEVLDVDERRHEDLAAPATIAAAWRWQRTSWPQSATGRGLRRHRVVARARSDRAARRERAARRQAARAPARFRESRISRSPGCAAGNRRQQAARVGVRRAREQIRDRRLSRRCARRTSRRRDRPSRRSRRGRA